MNKKSLTILIIVVLIFGAFFFLYSPAIFQEGNPWSQIKGIIQLNFGNTDTIKLSGSDNEYMTKNKNGEDVIKNFMKNKGYEFTERMGAGCLFNSPTGESAVATHRCYCRYYSLWKITEYSNGSETDDELWTATTTDKGVVFKYPQKLLAKYISETDWPPQVKIENTPFACSPSGKEIQFGRKTELRLVNNHPYCITKESESAAGSVYTNYTYSFPKNNKTEVITFILRFVQCQNYDEPKVSECENERFTFNIDNIVDRIAQSIQIQSKEMTIAEELKECLPKSDMESHEKCNELLSTINNFDDCVDAGFSIMKSNPSQCATPDERTFVQVSY